MAKALQTEESEIYHALPGVEVPVGEALASLSDMWNSPPASAESRPPSEFRASRMNLILHFGFDASLESAQALFQAAIGFSRRYPCRIIALCPSKSGGGSGQRIVCKIYSECYIGAKGKDMSCCEAILFNYALNEKRFLEDQISIFLESDLPTYYWPYRFDSPENLSAYQSFFKLSKRVVVDSAVESYSLNRLRLPQPEKLRDLAMARTLPIRQCIGQFFSAFPVADIVEGLTQVELTTPESLYAEGHALGAWLEGVLADCSAQRAMPRPEVSVSLASPEMAKSAASLRFCYESDNSVSCLLDLAAGVAQFTARIRGEAHSMTAAIKLLEQNEAMAEALFFS